VVKECLYCGIDSKKYANKPVFVSFGTLCIVKTFLIKDVVQHSFQMIMDVAKPAKQYSNDDKEGG
jgi:hypothetical protein